MTDQTTSASENADSQSPQSDVGTLLRKHRETAGFNIADIARVLRISQKYLSALEDGRNEDLPGTPYAIGFVRSYAEYLNLDGDEIVRRYKEEVEGLSAQTDLVFPKPIPDGGVPGTAVLGLGLVVAAVAYGVWYWQTNQGDVDIARVEEVPQHLAVEPQMTSETAQQASSEASQSSDKPSSVEPSSEQKDDASDGGAGEGEALSETSSTVQTGAAQPASPSSDDHETQTPSPSDEGNSANSTSADGAASQPLQNAEELAEAAREAAQSVVAEAADESPIEASAPTQALGGAETATSPAPNAASEPVNSAVSTAVTPPIDETIGDSRVRVRATSDSWIQVRDAGADRLLFSRLLREGEHYDVPSKGDLRLMTGNAGALEIFVDGDAVPAIGAMGELRRNVALDPEKLKSGEAVNN